jgi:hypothetical protein
MGARRKSEMPPQNGEIWHARYDHPNIKRCGPI